MDTAAAASTVNNDVVDIFILAGYFLNNSRDGDWLVVCLLGSILSRRFGPILHARGNAKGVV